MSEDVYARLPEFMDSLPAGYPSTPTGVELRILKKLYTPEHAELTMQLTQDPEEASAVAARLGKPEAELAPMLEDMAMKGLIFRTRDGEKRLYRAYQFIVGVYEFQVGRMDKGRGTGPRLDFGHKAFDPSGCGNRRAFAWGGGATWVPVDADLGMDGWTV